MSRFIIKHIPSVGYRKDGRSYSTWTTDDLQKARVFGRKCDARNAVNYTRHYRPEDWEVIPVTLEVNDES